MASPCRSTEKAKAATFAHHPFELQSALNSATYQKDTMFMTFHSENLQLDSPVGEKHETSPDRVFTGRLGNGMDVIVIRDHRRPIAIWSGTETVRRTTQLENPGSHTSSSI